MPALSSVCLCKGHAPSGNIQGTGQYPCRSGVGVVFVAVRSSDEVPSGLCITGSGARRKTGWLGHGAGVSCNVIRLLRSKGLLLAVRQEAVAGGQQRR